MASFTADALLSIREPEGLFPNSLDEAKVLHRQLAMQWHPDRNHTPAASKVLAHINRLYDLAHEKISAGSWRAVGVLALVSSDGREFRLKYLREHPFELGKMFISKKLVTFLVGQEHEDHLLRGLRAIGSIRYPDNRMRADMEKYFPKVEKVVTVGAAHGGSAIVLPKTEDLVLLRDLIAHLGGKIEPRHTAWVVSSLLNLVCFLELTGRTHNGLTPDTVFVSPRYHSAALLGGWWYSVEVGKPMVALPPAVHALASRSMLSSKIANVKLDLESIRAIGRACLGDPSGTGLRMRADVPAPLANWLRLPAPAKAVDDYENWQKVLTDSFGPRRFIKLDGCSGNDVYPIGG